MGKEQRSPIIQKEQSPDLFGELLGMGDLLADIQEKKRAVNPLIISVTGRSGSGKSGVISAEVKHAFPEETIVFRLDDYSKGNSFVLATNAAGGNINWDHPDYIDFPLFGQHLAVLKQNQSIQKPIFDFKSGERSARTELLNPKPIIIVEGIHSHHTVVQQFADIRVFVVASAESALARRLHRDVQRTTMTEEEIAH